MKEYIKKLEIIEDHGRGIGSVPSRFEVMDKINEIIDYLNDKIDLGFFLPPNKFNE